MFNFLLSTEQLAGFNPSSLGFGGLQPSPMFPEEGPGSEGPQPLMAPQKEMASFYQAPGEVGMMEAPRVRKLDTRTLHSNQSNGKPKLNVVSSLC